MFLGIRLKSHKGISVLELLNIGRINVICGKNNSGKTSILEALNVKENRVPWKYLDEKGASEVVAQFLSKIGRLSRIGMAISEDQLAMIQFKQLIKTGAHYADDWDSFSASFRQFFSGASSSTLEESIYALLGILKTAYKDNVETVFIPAKRQLSINGHLRFHEETSKIKAHPQGHGITETLFIWKNKDRTHPDSGLFVGLKEAFRFVTGGYDFDIYIEAGAKNDSSYGLSFSRNGGPYRGADSCGLGLREILNMLFFVLSPTNDVLLIDEPENHIHPDFQRRFLSYIYSSSSKQFFITTHSNVFLNAAYVDSVFFVSSENGTVVENVSSKAQILSGLGYEVTDNLVSDLVVLVEGPSDVPVLEQFLIKKGVLGRYNIKFWPLGGDIMAKTDLSVLSQGFKILALVDADPGSAKVRNRFVKKCRELNIPVHKLKRYGIENYFTLTALRLVFGRQIPENIQALNPAEKLEGQIGIDVKSNNYKVARAMEISDIEGTDLFEFLDLIEGSLEDGQFNGA